MPAAGGVGIAQKCVDLLCDHCFRAGRFRIDRAVHRLPPDDPARQAVGDRELPVQAVGPRHQLQSGQGESIAVAQGLLPVALAGPAVFRRQHQHLGRSIPEDQHVSGGKEDAQVRAPAIHIGKH
jgi:hypothetical protein